MRLEVDRRKNSKHKVRMFFRLALGQIFLMCFLLTAGAADVATPALSRLASRGVAINGSEKDDGFWEAVLQQLDPSEKKTHNDAQEKDFSKVFSDAELRATSVQQILNFYNHIPNGEDLARSFEHFVSNYPSPLASCVNITAIYVYREKEARLQIEGGSTLAYIALKDGHVVRNVWHTRTSLEAETLTEIPLVLIIPEKETGGDYNALIKTSLEEREATARRYLNYYYINAVSSLLRTISAEGARVAYRFKPPAGWIKSGLIDFCVFAEATRLLGMDSTAKGLSCLYPRADRPRFAGAIKAVDWDDSLENLGLHSKEEADNYALDACGTFVDYAGSFGTKDLNSFLCALQQESTEGPISTADALEKFKSITGKMLTDFSPYNPKFEKR